MKTKLVKALMERAAETAGAPTVKNPKALLKTVEKAEAKMQGILKALNELTAISVSLPGEFKAYIHAGNLSNIDTPKEYMIWVNIENLKGLYSLREEYKDTVKKFASLKEDIKAYPTK